MKTGKKTPPPAATPRSIEDDSEYAAFARRAAALEQRHARLVAAQIAIEAEHPRVAAIEVIATNDLVARAREMLAKPAAEDAPLPDKLPRLLTERRVLEKARELAADEGRRVGTAALHRLRAAYAPQWTELVREYALTCARLMALERRRDELFARIGYGPFGKLPLPLSEFQCGVKRGSGVAGSMQLVIDAAIAAGLVSKGELDEA